MGGPLSVRDVRAVSVRWRTLFDSPLAQLQALDDRMSDALLLLVGESPAHAPNQPQTLSEA
jgi:hypothetical protein